MFNDHEIQIANEVDMFLRNTTNKWVIQKIKNVLILLFFRRVVYIFIICKTLHMYIHINLQNMYTSCLIYYKFSNF